MVKKIGEKEAEELKNIHNQYIDKRKQIIKNTSFKAEDVFGDVISKDNFSQVQVTKLNIFFSENIVVCNIKINLNFFKPEKKAKIDYQLSEPSAPPEYSEF